jgi:hypothetical protein
MSDNIYSKLIGSGIAGLLESTVFHPLDTTSKRLMSNQNKLIIRGHDSNVYNIIFQTNVNKKLIQQIKSLYNGITFSLMHRITQRMYSYGGQPILRQYIEKEYIPNTKKDRIICETISGSIIGIGEIFFMPFDVLKIKKQTNINTFNNRSLYQIIKQENYYNYYKGAPITALRNFIAIGNFFFINSTIREYLFEKENQWELTFKQYAFISLCSSITSITISAPFDLVKTRIQNKNFGQNFNSIDVISNIIKHEGCKSFFKGLNTKLFIIAPKIIFSYSVSQYLISQLEK